MKSILESVTVAVKDVGDQEPGPYVAYTQAGVFYINSWREDAMLARLLLPDGNSAWVPYENLAIVPTHMTEQMTVEELERRKHDDQHTVQSFHRSLHPDEAEEMKRSDLIGKALSGGIAL